MKEKISNKVKSHKRYKTKDGTIVPGVTTIIGQLDKPALVRWANKMGLEGIDTAKYTDEKKEIGTLAHYLILCHLKQISPITSDFSPVVVDKAENCFLSYLNWEKQHKIEPDLIEEPLVSETDRFGGTPDLYGKVDGKPELLDFKTGNAIYSDYWFQIAGYGILLEERKHTIKNYRILNIPRTESEAFLEEQKSNINIQTKIFRNLLNIHYLKKELKYV